MAHISVPGPQIVAVFRPFAPQSKSLKRIKISQPAFLRSDVFKDTFLLFISVFFYESRLNSCSCSGKCYFAVVYTVLKTFQLTDTLRTQRTYRKIPVISPGLIQLHKGFWMGL